MVKNLFGSYGILQARNKGGGGIWGICPHKFSKHCIEILTFEETFK